RGSRRISGHLRRRELFRRTDGPWYSVGEDAARGSVTSREEARPPDRGHQRFALRQQGRGGEPLGVAVCADRSYAHGSETVPVPGGWLLPQNRRRDAGLLGFRGPRSV